MTWPHRHAIALAFFFGSATVAVGVHAESTKWNASAPQGQALLANSIPFDFRRIAEAGCRGALVWLSLAAVQAAVRSSANRRASTAASRREDVVNERWWTLILSLAWLQVILWPQLALNQNHGPSYLFSSLLTVDAGAVAWRAGHESLNFRGFWRFLLVPPLLGAAAIVLLVVGTDGLWRLGAGWQNAGTILVLAATLAGAFQGLRSRLAGLTTATASVIIPDHLDRM
jgi:hypothetical protein